MAIPISTFSFNDPMYLHPSNGLGTSLVVIPLNGSENYSVWSRATKIALHAKNKIGLITGTCSKPAVNSPTLYQWERCNAVVFSWNFSSVSKEIFCGLVYANDASSVWADLKERFDKVCGSRIYAIIHDIVRLSQGSATISVYFSKLKQLWDELASLVTSPSCDCPTSRSYVDHEQQQQQRLIQLKCDGISTHCKHTHLYAKKKHISSTSFCKSSILTCMPRRSTSQCDGISTHCRRPTQAFYSSEQSAPVKCDHCSIPGHTKEHCFRLIGYPPGHKLHKKFPPKQIFKHNSRNMKVSAHNSVSDTTATTDESQSIPSSCAHFTPTQYAQLL